MTILIYSKKICPYCDMAKNLLQMKGLSFEVIMVDESTEKLQEMLQRSEGRKTVPQIFINGQGIGGFDNLQSLEHSGELDQLLQKK